MNSDVNYIMYYFQIIRLNGEIGRLRGELEKIRLGSVVNHSTDNSCTITQLQAALAMERENCRDVSNERDSLIKEIAELKRQVSCVVFFFLF